MVRGERGQRQGHQLRSAQPAGIEQLEYGDQAQAGRLRPLPGGGDQRLDLGLVEQPRQGALPARTVDRLGRIIRPTPFQVHEAMELADRRQAARHGGARHAALRQLAQIRAHRSGIGGLHGEGAPLEKAAIVGEIAPVGVERVSARAALDRHHLEEGLAPWPVWHDAGRLTGH